MNTSHLGVDIVAEKVPESIVTEICGHTTIHSNLFSGVMKRDRLWTSLWVLYPGQKAERNTTGAKARPGSGAATAPSKRQKWQKRYKNRQTNSNGTARSQHFWKLNVQRLGCFSCFPKMMCLRICSWLQIYSHQKILLTLSTLLMQTILGILLYSGYVPLSM